MKTKLADVLVMLSDGGSLSARFIAGADATVAIEPKQASVQEQIDKNRKLSAALSYDS